MSGVGRTQTRATTLKATYHPTMKGCRCCSLIASWASSWCLARCPGTTTSWVSRHRFYIYYMNFCFHTLITRDEWFCFSLNLCGTSVISSILLQKSVPHIDISNLSRVSLIDFYCAILCFTDQNLSLFCGNEKSLFVHQTITYYHVI